MRNTFFRLSSTLIALIATTLFCVAAERPSIYKPAAAETMMIVGLSDNGRYAVSQNAGAQDVDNPQPAGGMLYDLTTHMFTNIPAPQGFAGVCDVSDDGIVAGSCDSQPAIWSLLTGTWTKLPLPAGCDLGGLLSITPDGHYAVGYAGKYADYLYAEPVLYDLSTLALIGTPNLPEVDQTGTNQNQNVFYNISPDGRYLLGQMSQSFLMPLSMITYVYDTMDHSWRALGFDYDASAKKYTPKVDGLHFISDQSMSCNGRWVTGSAYMVHGGGEISGGEEYYCSYRYDVYNDQIEVYNKESERDIVGNRITNDGVILACTPSGYPYPTAMIRSGNFFISLDQTLSQVYHISLAGQIGDNITGAFQCVSADGLTAVMHTYDNCYIIKMNEPFDQAAAQVDLLANYTPSIPQRSNIGRIGELRLTFDREIECKNLPSSIQLLKGDGSLVRNATSTSIAPANSHQLIVTFRTQTLEADETYEVVIPADYIWLKEDPAIKSREIRLTYFGRGTEAVELVSVTPRDGSVLAEINSTSSYITATYNADVKPAEHPQCTLYNDDTGEALASLVCTTTGRKAYFFTEGDFMLYYGSNYRIEIGEGAVTDMSGSGASAPITLKYTGSYIRSAGEDDIYLFNADCNDYDHFLFHSNQTYTPSTVPASWGFVPESTWLVVGDNPEDTDLALCSHSMFAPAAQADDWLVIPRLYIPDDKATLLFDAQSYLKNKSDRLQIYIYQSDMIYNYLSSEITDRFIADGTLVFDEVLSPGDSQESLAGDWTHYSIPLDAYAEKTIYIAFVNRNFDQSAIFIDNVKVMRDLDFTLTNSTPEIVVAADELEVTGILAPGTGADIHGVHLTLRDADRDIVDEITDPDAVVSAESPYAFRFGNRLQLVFGEANTYYIDVTIGDKTSTMTYTVKNLAFRTTRRVVLEEYSGRTCGNCPQGFIAVDNLISIYGDAFIPVVIRTYGGDQHGHMVTGYSQYLGLDSYGAPSGRINRGDILAPMYQNGSAYVFSGKGISDAEGNAVRLWLDDVIDLMSAPAEISVDFSVNYDETSRAIEIPVSVRSALNAPMRNINLLAVVVENNLPAPQLNYFNNISDPILGDWGMGGAYGKLNVFPFLVNHAARYVINAPAYNGTAMAVTDFKAGDIYTETITATLPDGAITNAANCEVVVMVIDGSSHKILNANRAAFGTSGIDAVQAADTEIVATNGTITVSTPGNFTARVFTVSGALIGTVRGLDTADIPTNAYRGTAIVTISTPHSSVTKKIIIK